MKAARASVVAILAFITYIVFTGSISVYDIVTGILTAAIVGALFANITLSNARKVVQPTRWLYLFIYALRYFFIDETKAHVDVIKRILHPRVPVNPAIVEVPYELESDYAITATANSITNTPGTVVVDINQEKRAFYVHWIDAKTLEPQGARENISAVFEKFAKKVFD